jgi:hypothetical protein
MRFPASNPHFDWPVRHASDLQFAGRDGCEVKFSEEDGLVLFDRAAEHHLFVPFLTMVLRRFQRRPESRAAVRNWVGARDSSSQLGFDYLCNYLDLDPDYFRDGLTRWMNKVDGVPEEDSSRYAPGRPVTNSKSSGW